MGQIAPLIAALLGLLKPNPSGNERRNLRVAKRTYKQLRKEFKKDGLDEEEKEMLKELKESIFKRALELGK